MEVKHFSHNHGLTFHQVPPGSEVQCSGCRSPASGNTYACWQCNYFLHEQCFRAARSLSHPSHPHHPLTLLPFPTYPSASFFCNSCNLGGHGFSYTCSQCEFDIHLHCALMPTPNPHVHVPPTPLPALNPIYPPQPQPATYPTIPNSPLPNINPAYPPNQNNPPQTNATPQTSPPQPLVAQPKPSATIMHFSHLHVLKSIEIEQKDNNVCSACEWVVSGTAYCCTEPHCSFILDKACFDCPREVRHKSHPQHPLTLLAGPPHGKPTFDCYACWKTGKGLPYACLTCSITIHLDCIDWPEKLAAGVAHEHEMSLYYLAAEASGGKEVSAECSVCNKDVDPKAWRYYCRQCGVGVHTGCRPAGKSESGEETMSLADSMFKMQQQHQINMFRLQMAKQNAQFMNSLANSWKNF